MPSTLLHIFLSLHILRALATTTLSQLTINEENFFQIPNSIMDNQFPASFTDQYQQLVIDSSLKTVTEESMPHLSTVKSAIERKLKDSRDAGSRLRYAAQYSNTPDHNQEFLHRVNPCEINSAEVTSGTYLYDLPADISFSYSSEYKNQVNDSYSVVSTAVDVYHCSTEVKKEIYWTRSLDSVFEQNKHQTPDLSYQYFATPGGAIRIFPATQFSVPLTYDNRFEQFYVQSSTLPKVIVIALDSSGSVNGQVTQFMQNTLDTILDTVTDRDLLSIFFFKNDHVHLLPTVDELEEHSCGDPKRLWYVRGSYKNKQALKNSVATHSNFNGTADFHIPFQQAKLIFEQAPKDEYCSKLLVVITDGGKGAATEAGDTLTKLTDSNPDMNLMIFLEGPDVYDTKNNDLPVLACSGHGYFYRVGSEESVRFSVAEFTKFQAQNLILHVISSQNVSSPEWSNPSVRPWNSNSGPVLTVTHSAFNSSDDQISSLLGVSAVDFPVLNFLVDTQSGSPREGEYFLVNQRGSVVFSEELGKLVSHFPRIIHFPEVHQTDYYSTSNVKSDLESLIVTATDPGSKTGTEVVDIPGVQYAGPSSSVNYNWDKLADLPFVLVKRKVDDPTFGKKRVIPSDATLDQAISEAAKKAFLMQFGNANFKAYTDEGVSETDLSVRLYFSSSIYCPGLETRTNTYSEEEIRTFLQDEVFNNPEYPDIVDCKENPAYWSLLIDLYFLYTTVNAGYFPTVDETSSNYANHAFIKFNSGLLFTYGPQTSEEGLELQNTWEILRNEHSAIILSTLANSALQKIQMRVNYNPYTEIEERIVCFRNEHSYWSYDTHTYTFPIVLTRPLRIQESSTSLPVGVIGNLMLQKFNNLGIWRVYGDEGCPANSKCLLLDEGGFLVADSAAGIIPDEMHLEYKIGSNLATVDYCLMVKLVSDGVYKKQTVDHNTCACSYAFVMKNSPSEVLTSMLQRSLKFVLNGALAMMQALLSLQLMLNSVMQIVFMPHVSQQLETGIQEIQLCQRRIDKYYFGHQSEISNGQLSNCGENCDENCERTYSAKRIAESNLLLVTLPQICPPCDQSPPSPRVRAVPEKRLFTDKLGNSVDDDGNAMKEYKVNTCEYVQTQHSTKLTCSPTHDQSRIWFTECDSCDDITHWRTLCITVAASITLSIS